jgi:hypothetical protein
MDRTQDEIYLNMRYFLNIYLIPKILCGLSCQHHQKHVCWFFLNVRQRVPLMQFYFFHATLIFLIFTLQVNQYFKSHLNGHMKNDYDNKKAIT